MPFDPSDAIGALQRALSLIPATLLVIVLLTGPTLIWLLYRFVVQPRTSRYPSSGTDLLWMCERCRSANEVRLPRCYRCGLEREAIVGDLRVLDGEGFVTLAGRDPEDLDDDFADDDFADDDFADMDLPAIPVIPVVVPVAPMSPAAKAAGPRRLVAVGPGRGSAGTRRREAAPVVEAAPEPTPGAPSTAKTRPVRKRAAKPVAAGGASDADRGEQLEEA